MAEPPSKITKSERALLRQLAQEAWGAELDSELEQLFESFSRWADDGMSAFELSDRFMSFTTVFLGSSMVVTPASIQRLRSPGQLRWAFSMEEVLGDTLYAKLKGQIAGFRTVEDE